MYVLSIRLKSNGYEKQLEKRFWLMYKLKRATIQWFNTQEHRRVSSEEYKLLATEFKEYLEVKETLSKADQKAQDKEFMKKWGDLNSSFKLDSSKFVKYTDLGQATNMFRRYSAEGYVNWSSFEDLALAVKKGYLKRRKQPNSENTMKIPRYVDFHGFIVRKRNSNVTEDGLFLGASRGAEREKGIYLPFDFEANKGKDIELAYALSEQKMSYWGIYRKQDKFGHWVYYAQIIFDGEPYRYHHIGGQEKVRISVDVDTLELTATNSKQTVRYDLTRDHGISDKLSNLDRLIENSRRVNNPQNFNEDGTIKQGRLKWNNTKTYYKLLGKRRYIWHKLTQTRKNFYGRVINNLLEFGSEFEVHMQDFKALQERIKYNKETMSWFDSRKSRGAEIMFNAPSEFIRMLDTKLTYNGLSAVKQIKVKEKQ